LVFCPKKRVCIGNNCDFYFFEVDLRAKSKAWFKQRKSSKDIMGIGRKQIGIMVLVIATLCSCSNETVEQDVPMLNRIVEVSIDGLSLIHI
jgi:hypothetical protein